MRKQEAGADEAGREPSNEEIVLEAGSPEIPSQWQSDSSLPLPRDITANSPNLEDR